ncbi:MULTISPECIES: response regulator [unclassified Tolypothrix]|uniref:response regulator n=1 Tax=unclassified Tolypothrix TaxID=2649714 RepID=UPI0005EABC3B|nr:MULTISPECIES: response regulator [unclassified Tolypothrix]BAY89156.1 response regulator receiver protein [Microchaete diplosiphon NIES-3275]EKE96826.1 response regulator [Tolypothrix sp. PCC 7601]MBE9087802.1 response regulator [Tolypothrix sp. LEGE 11397]UYD23454.1 response regulator [Tolypothrix sp. PCC 7712]UYD34314.1 response regulator [Tolypothrix sp. PCC 7601]
MTAQLISLNERLKSQAIKRILLIEDNDVNRMLLSDYLSHFGYDVQSLSLGSALFTTVEKFQPELILLDLKLPDIDGYSLLAQIKQKPEFAKIPIIVVSAFAFEIDQQRAINLGAWRYFVKPINLKALMMTIQEKLAC